MATVTARLLFLAFLGLTATIIYNALYLQEDGSPDVIASTPVGYAETRVIGVEPQGGAAAGNADTYADAGAGSTTVVTDVPELPGSAGESQLVVRAIQRELSLRGYDVGAVDGQLSDKTRQAISAFQSREGLTVTGLPSDDVLRQILLGDTVAIADTTATVAETAAPETTADGGGTILQVQQVLAELGYAPGAIDGAWGQNTADAVSAFQRDRGMAVTGSISPELLAELQRVSGRDLTRSAARL